MAEMSDMGYLRQPHTSAGRVPSDLGYRFYVDRLMSIGMLGQRERELARSAYDETENDLERILAETCKVLSGLTKYASVATQRSDDDVEIRHVSLTPLHTNRSLLIIVFSNGRVEHRIFRAQAAVRRDLSRVSSTLDACLSNRSVGEICAGPDMETPPAIAAHAEIFQSALGHVRQVARTLLEGGIFVDGANYILRQPEFQDVHKAEAVLDELEQRKDLFRILSVALLGPETCIVIGSENPCVEMRECSFVASRYRIGDRLGGTIGVIGPTRMDYRRAVAAVDFMAKNLTDLLTYLSIG